MNFFIEIYGICNITASDSGQKIYFKIHGSAEPAYRESIVFTLRHERLMPAWKRELLRRVLTNKNLLVIGYSGLDFEICPELLQIPVKRIFWNNFREDFPSPDAERVLAQHPENCLLVGDLRELISDLFEPVSAVPGAAEDRFVKEIQQRLTADELTLWRLALLNSMGCPGIALRIIRHLEKQNSALSEQVEVIRQKAQALFHAGQYRESSRQFTRSARRAPVATLQAESWLDACDAWRCYGGFCRAGKCLGKSSLAMKRIQDRSVRKRVLGKIHLKRVLLFRPGYQLCCPIKRWHEIIQKKNIEIAFKIFNSVVFRRRLFRQKPPRNDRFGWRW